MGLRLLLGVAGVAAITTGLIRRHRKNLELAGADEAANSYQMGDDAIPTDVDAEVDAAPISKAKTRPVLTPDAATTPIN